MGFLNYIFVTLIIIFSSCLCHLQAQNQKDTIIYDLYVNEEVIGDLVAVRSINPDSTIQLEVTSEADYRFLFSFHIRFHYVSSYNAKGEFISSEFLYLMNDDIKETNWINCNTQNCSVYEGDELKEIIDNKTGLTALNLYFNEPQHNEIVFSERFADYFEVEKEDDDGYKVDFPGGSTNHYYYKNGSCYKIKINTLISDMVFRLREN